MERSEQVGLGVAAAGHVLLFGLLSVGFLATPNPLKLETKPIDISLVDDVALEAAAPAQIEAPQASEAPEIGAPDDAAPPPEPVPETAVAPALTPPQPVTPAPPTPPPPRPAPVSRPAPVKPTPAKPAPPKPVAAKPAPAKPTPAKPAPAKPRPDRLASVVAGAGSDAATPRPRPRGSQLGADFRKGLAITPEKGNAPTPRAAAVSASAVAGLGDAIARQVQPCANRIPNPGPGANLIRSKLRLRMNADGTLAQRPTLTGQTGVNDANQRYAQRVGELAMSAIIQCAPYELPDELYEAGWKDIIINYRLPG